MKYIRIFDGLEQYDDILLMQLHLTFYCRLRELNSDQRIMTNFSEIKNFFHSDLFAYAFNRYLIDTNSDADGNGGMVLPYNEHPSSTLRECICGFFESDFYEEICECNRRYWEEKCDNLQL